MTDDHLLLATLDLAVPLRIADLQRHGGPKTIDLELTRDAAEILAATGDDLLFGGGPAKHIAAELICAIAVMAFLPGGITAFGRHWEA